MTLKLMILKKIQTMNRFKFFRSMPFASGSGFSLLMVWLVFSSLNPLGAQSLEALLQATEMNSLPLQALKQEYRAAQEMAPQVSQLPDPELGIGVFAMPLETRLGPQRWRFGISQMFPWPGRLAEQRDLALAQAQVPYHQIAIDRLEIKYEIRQAYYQLYELEKSKAILAENLRLLRTMERLALGRVESGKGDLADVVNVQLQTRELEQQIELLKVRQVAPRTRLNNLLNRTLNDDIEIVDTLSLAQLPDTLEQWVIRLGTDHPQTRQVQARIAVAQQALLVNSLQAKPDIGLGLDYAILGKRTDADPVGNGQNMIMPRLMFRLPLYREKYRAKVREENYRIAALNDRQEDITNRLSINILQAIARHEEAVLMYELAENQIQTLDRLLNLLRTTYSTEGRQFDDLLENQRRLLTYELKKLQAVVQSHLAVAALQR